MCSGYQYLCVCLIFHTLPDSRGFLFSFKRKNSAVKYLWDQRVIFGTKSDWIWFDWSRQVKCKPGNEHPSNDPSYNEHICQSLLGFHRIEEPGWLNMRTSSEQFKQSRKQAVNKQQPHGLLPCSQSVIQQTTVSVKTVAGECHSKYQMFSLN